MGAPLFLRKAVVDAARDLIRATERLQTERTETLEIVAMLEARWAANRAAYLDKVADTANRTT